MASKAVKKYRITVPKVEGDRTKWITVGWASLLADGKIVGDFDAIPINWTGTFYLFEREDNEPPY